MSENCTYNTKQRKQMILIRLRRCVYWSLIWFLAIRIWLKYYFLKLCIIWVTHAPNEDINQPAHQRSLTRVFAVHMKKLCMLGYPKCAQWRFWSDCANAQADLNLRRSHMSERYIFWRFGSLVWKKEKQTLKKQWCYFYWAFYLLLFN